MKRDDKKREKLALAVRCCLASLLIAGLVAAVADGGPTETAKRRAAPSPRQAASAEAAAGADANRAESRFGGAGEVVLSDAEADQAAVQAALRRAYEGPEFWWKRTAEVADPDLPWLIRAIRTAGRWLAKAVEAVLDVLFWILRYLFGWMFSADEAGAVSLAGWATWLLLIAVAVLVAGLFVWNGLPLLRQWLGQEFLLTRGPAAERAESLPTPHRLLAQAREWLGRGQFREAVRYAYLAVVAGLQDRGWLRYDPSRTNGEYYRELLPRGAIADRFRLVAADFERVWYGGRWVDQGGAEKLIGLCEQLLHVGSGDASERETSES